MYVQLDGDYFGHPKTIHLQSIIGPEADAYPPRLWVWAAKYAKSGTLKSRDTAEVACAWKGRKGLLLKALIDSGFLEKDGVTIHSWMEYTGKDLENYEKKKRNLREVYRKTARILPEDCRNSALLAERNGTELDKLNGTSGDSGASAPSAPVSGGVQEHLATVFRAAVKTPLSQAKAMSHIGAALEIGVPAQSIEEAFMSPSNKGRKIWEILDTLRESHGPSENAKILEIMKKFEVDRNGTH